MKKDIQKTLNSPYQKWAKFLHKTKARFKRKHKETISILTPYIHPNTVILDIGANFGYFAKEFSRLHKKTCQVICFEPVSYNFDILKTVTKSFKNIKIEKIALSNTRGTMEIKIPLKESGKIGPALAHFGEEIRNYTSETVNTETLDQYLSAHKIDTVDFIKIDVEGAEFFVIEGAKETLKKNRPVIFCEINNDYTQRIQKSAQNVFSTITQHGYKAFIVQKDISAPVESYTTGGDYLFIPT